MHQSFPYSHTTCLVLHADGGAGLKKRLHDDEMTTNSSNNECGMLSLSQQLVREKEKF